MDLFFASEGLETRLRRDKIASRVSVEDKEFLLPFPEKQF